MAICLMKLGGSCFLSPTQTHQAVLMLPILELVLMRSFEWRLSLYTRSQLGRLTKLCGVRCQNRMLILIYSLQPLCLGFLLIDGFIWPESLCNNLKDKLLGDHSEFRDINIALQWCCLIQTLNSKKALISRWRQIKQATAASETSQKSCVTKLTVESAISKLLYRLHKKCIPSK